MNNASLPSALWTQQDSSAVWGDVHVCEKCIKSAYQKNVSNIYQSEQKKKRNKNERASK